MVSLGLDLWLGISGLGDFGLGVFGLLSLALNLWLGIFGLGSLGLDLRLWGSLASDLWLGRSLAWIVGLGSWLPELGF